MSNDEYEIKLYNQNFSCPICGEQLNNKNVSIDHDHDTGNNRGILCRECNSGIGKLKDDVKTVSNAVDYLKRYIQM